MAKYLIAHDLGTSGNKATLFSVEGKLIASAEYHYPLYSGGPGWAEQEGEDWWRSVCETSRALCAKIDPAEVAGVAFSGQMMGCLCLDKEGKPLRRSMIWADMRAETEEQFIRAHMDGQRFYRITGARNSAAYSICKLMWLKAHQPEIYEKTACVLNAKDYMVYRLTGRLCTEPTDASGTGMFDINTGEWSKELLSLCGLDGDKLPEIIPSTAVAGYVTGRAAAECGLPEGTPVIPGGGDGICAAVGSGATRPGVANCCLGTSSWVSFASSAPVVSPRALTCNFAHAAPGQLLPCGSMQCGGGALSWAVSQLYSEKEREETDVYPEVNRLAEAAGAGAGGLLFLPYLLGERAPRWNPRATGAFVGLTFNHTRGDMLRAVMEGVGYNLNMIIGDFRQNGGDIRELVLLGGGARNPVWCRILADIFGLPVVLPNHLESATSMGAAITAGVGLGIYEDFDAISLFLSRTKVFEPQGESAEKYREMQQIFDETYYALEGIYDRIYKIKEAK